MMLTIPMTNTFKNFAVIFSLTVLSAFSAGAWTIFGSQESALKDKLKSGDRYMERADAAYEAGNMERASGYYEKALQRYGYIDKKDPGFMEGIAAVRISYCATQYTNAAIAFAEAQIEEIDEENAKESAEKDDAPVQSSTPQPPTLNPFSLNRFF